MTNANSHPYKNFGPRAFWSLSVAHNFDPNALIEIDEPLIRRTDKIVSAGSCFASNVPPYLVRFGFNYFRSEIEHPAFPELAHMFTDTAISALLTVIFIRSGIYCNCFVEPWGVSNRPSVTGQTKARSSTPFARV